MSKTINSFPEVLTIAGTDSGGGAGIMADLKTFQARHVFGTAVVVAVTAQNTLDVQASKLMPQSLINAQFAAIAEDFQIRACKTGMLGDSNRVRAVVQNLKKYNFGPIIVDPVMIAKGGTALLSEEAIVTVKRKLLPLATLITPNIPEAEKLTGQHIENKVDFQKTARILQNLGAQNVLIKGGHQNSDTVSDYVLLANQTHFWLTKPRTHTNRTHGTGDTISACITAELAHGADLATAIRCGKNYVTATIEHPIQVGHGHGPLNHWAAQKEGLAYEKI